MKTIKYIDVGSYMPRSKAIKQENVKEEDIVWDYQALEQLRQNPELFKDVPRDVNIATRPWASWLSRLGNHSGFVACGRDVDGSLELVRGVLVWAEKEEGED